MSRREWAVVTDAGLGFLEVRSLGRSRMLDKHMGERAPLGRYRIRLVAHELTLELKHKEGVQDQAEPHAQPIPCKAPLRSKADLDYRAVESRKNITSE